MIDARLHYIRNDLHTSLAFGNREEVDWGLKMEDAPNEKIPTY